MNNTDITADIELGFCVEVVAARNNFHSEITGNLVRQSYYIYGNGRVSMIEVSDSREKHADLFDDDAFVFRSIYSLN